MPSPAYPVLPVAVRIFHHHHAEGHHHYLFDSVKKVLTNRNSKSMNEAIPILWFLIYRKPLPAWKNMRVQLVVNGTEFYPHLLS
jgi:hypothetical protein